MFFQMADAVREGEFAKAYLVLGGDKWTLRRFYTEGGLKKYLVDSNMVEIIALEPFVARSNKGDRGIAILVDESALCKARSVFGRVPIR